MDIERQNFMKEVEAEIKKTKAILKKGADVSNFGDPLKWQKEARDDRKIDELFNECKTRFGSTLEKLKD